MTSSESGNHVRVDLSSQAYFRDQLARLEGACAVKALFRRWPRLTLAVDASEVRWRERPGVRAIEHLPVAAG
jgi:cytochrome P450